MKKLFRLCLVLVLASLATQAQTRYASAVQFLQPAKASVPGLASNSASSRAFDFSSEEAAQLFFSTDKAFVLSNFPVGLSESATVQLKEASSVFDGETHVYKMVNGARVELALPQSRCFGGSIKGESGSRVFVVMTGNEMFSSIERADGTMLQVAPALTKKNTAILQDNTHGPSNSFRCGFENLPDAHLPVEYSKDIKMYKGSSLQSTDLLEARVAIETDRFLYTKMGKDEAKITRYLYTIFATVSWIYEREVNVHFTLGDIIIHTDTDPDPYTQNALGDIGALLGEFSSNWKKNYGPVKRNVAVLFTVPGKTEVGGIAYLGSLCTNNGFAACGIQTTSTLPTQGYQWDSFVTAHEVGHTFNAKHTHACDWAPPIDSCVSTGGSQPVGDACWMGTPKPNKGSIMSYCHLFFPPPRYTFLSQVAAVVRAGAEKTGCLKVPTAAVIKVTQPIGGADQIVRIDTGVSIEWTSAKVTNVNIEYSLDAGKTFNVIPAAVNLPATNRSYKWVPAAGTGSTQAMIRIYQTGNQSIADTSYATFTLGAPTLNLRTLAGGERIGRKTTELLIWDRSFLSKNKLEFSATGTDPWTTVLPDTSLTQYSWKVPDIDASAAKLRIVGGSDNSIISMSGAFAIGTPTLSLTSPVSLDSACVGTKIQIKWQSDFVRQVDIRYSRNNGLTFPLSQSIASATDASTGSFTWTVPANKNTDSAIVRITNVADGNQVVLSQRFIIKVCEGVNSVNQTPEMNGVRIARLYPTPASDVLMLSLQNNRPVNVASEIEVVANDGRSALRLPVQLEIDTQSIAVPVRDLVSGSYIVIVRTEGAELSLPFVVAR